MCLSYNLLHLLLSELIEREWNCRCNTLLPALSNSFERPGAGAGSPSAAMALTGSMPTAITSTSSRDRTLFFMCDNPPFSSCVSIYINRTWYDIGADCFLYQRCKTTAGSPAVVAHVPVQAGTKILSGVSDLSSLRRHHSDPLAGLFTPFRPSGVSRQDSTMIFFF